jgi:hypothetical protein
MNSSLWEKQRGATQLPALRRNWLQHSYQRYGGANCNTVTSVTEELIASIVRVQVITLLWLLWRQPAPPHFRKQFTNLHAVKSKETVTQQNRCENLKCQQINSKAEMSYLISRHARDRLRLKCDGTHAETDFVFRRNGRVPLNRRGRQFSLLLAAEVCASAVVMLDTPCSEVVWRVLATHSIHHFPLHFLSRALPCAITFELDFNSLPVDGWQVTDIVTNSNYLLWMKPRAEFG